jgi:hypothetical protein
MHDGTERKSAEGCASFAAEEALTISMFKVAERIDIAINGRTWAVEFMARGGDPQARDCRA